MAMSDDAASGHEDAVLAAAATTIREEPVPGWVEVGDSIRARVRAVSRRGRPLRAVTDAGREVRVTDLVLVGLLRAAVAVVEGCELARVETVGSEDTCTGLVLTVVGAYGHDLPAVAERVRAVAYETVRQALGPVRPPFGSDGVDVVVADLADPGPDQTRTVLP